jgi:hypothetical protein
MRIGRCAYRKLNPSVLVMQPAQDRTAKNVSGPLNGARQRRRRGDRLAVCLAQLV